MFQSKGVVTDVLSILAYCKDDETYLLVEETSSSDYWIPSTKMEGSSCWENEAKTFLEEVKLSCVNTGGGMTFKCYQQIFIHEVEVSKLRKITKVWTPQRDFFHVVFEAIISLKAKAKCNSRNCYHSTLWVTSPDVLHLIRFLRSSELLELVNWAVKTKGYGEVVPMGPLTEMTEERILTIDPAFNPLQVQMLQQAGCTVERQIMIYEVFFLRTFPCLYMSRKVLTQVMSDYGWFESCEALFRAADTENRLFLTFQNFLYLVAVMQPRTPHLGVAALMRSRYIFRYFDVDGRKTMNQVKFKALITAIHKTKNNGVKKKQLDTEINTAFRLIGFKKGSTMDEEEFTDYVTDMKIRSTSVLLRLPKNVWDVEMQDLPKIPYTRRRRSSAVETPIAEVKRQVPSQDFQLAPETVDMQSGGIVINVTNVEDVRGGVSRSIDRSMLPPVGKVEELITRAEDVLLALMFFAEEVTKEEALLRAGRCSKDPFSWRAADLTMFGTNVIALCEDVKSIAASEPRLLEVQTPVYIMGDLHGNYRGLHSFEEALWPSGIGLLPAKLLFLGDYVDRGPCSLEVVSYLLATKCLNPTKVYLLRGNHECREIQQQFTFLSNPLPIPHYPGDCLTYLQLGIRECTQKLGALLGQKVWDAVNSVFDVLPLAAVIEGKVFCCHGGVPPPWLCPVIAAINTIPVPLRRCEEQSPLAWSLMWNDPLSTRESEVDPFELAANQGFAVNVRRGTGHVFSSEALDRFLVTNHLSHIIRAHEAVYAGFQVQQKGKVLTVFSSSQYCGGSNKAGCILAAHGTLRIIRFHAD